MIAAKSFKLSLKASSPSLSFDNGCGKSRAVGGPALCDEVDEVVEALAGVSQLGGLAPNHVGDVAAELGDLVGDAPKGVADDTRLKEPGRGFGPVQGSRSKVSWPA